MLNKVILVGHLGKDPEIRHFEGGSKVCKFSMATNESYQDKTTNEWKSITEWHDIVCWGALAERVDRTLKKGNLVYVEGKVTTRKWQDKDGNNRYTTEIKSNVIKALERAESSGGGGNGNNFPSVDDQFPSGPQIAEGMPQQQEQPQQQPQPISAPESQPIVNESTEDDLPF